MRERCNNYNTTFSKINFLNHRPELLPGRGRRGDVLGDIVDAAG